MISDNKRKDIESICLQYGQDHIIKYIQSVNDDQIKSRLYAQLEKIDFRLLDQVFQNMKLVDDDAKFDRLTPLKNVQYSLSKDDYIKYTKKGLDILKDGKAAVLILAGGQGTRLGFDKAKGMYDIGLPSHKSIFQLFCERINSLQNYVLNECGQCREVPIYIMTSIQNDTETKIFFAVNQYFGLSQDQIIFFTQDSFPILSFEGKLMMENEQNLLTGSNGNGAFLESLNSNGHLKFMQNNGIEYIQLIGIDNVLAKLADPTMIGYMEDKNLKICSKFVKKFLPGEKVGVHAAIDNKPYIVEYSEIPQKLEQALDEQNNLIFNQGNICQMMAKTEFLISLTKNDQMLKQFTSKLINFIFRYHVAKKKNIYFDILSRQIIKPLQPNTNKFELFYFDIFSLCEINQFGLLEAIREEEFAPVKNAPGSSEDSPDTARLLTYKRDQRWLENLGLQFQEDNGQVEISPNITYHGENLEWFASTQSNKKIELPCIITNLSLQQYMENKQLNLKDKTTFIPYPKSVQ